MDQEELLRSNGTDNSNVVMESNVLYLVKRPVKVKVFEKVEFFTKKNVFDLVKSAQNGWKCVNFAIVWGPVANKMAHSSEF